MVHDESATAGMQFACPTAWA